MKRKKYIDMYTCFQKLSKIFKLKKYNSELNEDQMILVGKEDKYGEELNTYFVDLNNDNDDKQSSRSSPPLHYE